MFLILCHRKCIHHAHNIQFAIISCLYKVSNLEFCIERLSNDTLWGRVKASFDSSSVKIKFCLHFFALLSN